MRNVAAFGIGGLTLALIGSTACGPMYQQPGQQPGVQGPPGASNQGWQQPTGAQTNAANPASPSNPGPSGPPTLPQPEPSRPTPPNSGLPADAAAFVDAHNRVRAAHCAAPLTWSPKLAEVAQRWANTLRDQGCKFSHMPNNSNGENLAMGTSGALDPGSTVAMWYDEVKQYKFPSGGFSMQTGHFTQVVWRGTTEVGCARSQCQGNDIYVCEYNPPGNYERQYESNVLPIGCK